MSVPISNVLLSASCPANAEFDCFTYRSYLALGTVLAAQKPRSRIHDEMLFIVQHQVSELWFKLVLHELIALREMLKRDQLPAVFKSFVRVERIMDQLINAWDVLATLTPAEYLQLRPALGQASGSQSHQYRHFEFLLGNKDASQLAQLETDIPEAEGLLQELRTPSLYDEAVAHLARAGFAIDQRRLQPDHALGTTHDDSVAAAWAQVYRNIDAHPLQYALAERLVDLEADCGLWRFRHLGTVERVIGTKSGTGGTSGAPYLRKRLEVVLFPELASLRSIL